MEQNLSNLIKCPNCSNELIFFKEEIICNSCEEKYPIIFDVPVLITKKKCESLGLDYYTESFKEKIIDLTLFKKNEFGIMALNEILVYTNGILYEKINKPTKYPIPDIPFERNQSDKNLLIDIGCGWGRWTISAAQKGYNAVGIDKNLIWLIFAKKMAEQLNIKNCNFICCDVLNLPIKDISFDKVYSFSFLQHFSEENLQIILNQIHKIIKPKGVFKTLMVNKYSLRGLYNEYKIKNSRIEMLQKGRIEERIDDNNFNVRYFSIKKINNMFKLNFNLKNFQSYCFFTQAQKEDLSILIFKSKIYIIISLFLTSLFKFIPFSKYISDNLIYTLEKNEEKL